MEKAGLFIEELEKLDFGPFAAQVENAVDRIFSSMNFEVMAKNISNFFTSIMNGAQIFLGLAETVWKLRVPIVAIVGAVSILNGVMTALAVGEKIYTGIKTILTGASYAYLIVVKGQTHALGFLAAETNGVKLATAAWSVVMKAWNGLQYLGGLIKIGAQLVIAKAQTLAMAAAQHIAAAAQWVLNVAMSANPIALIIIGIAALIGIIIALVKNWDAVTAVLGKVWEWIKGVGSAFMNLGKTILYYVLAPVEELLGVLTKIPGVSELLGPALDKVHEFRSGLRGTEELTETVNVVPGEITKTDVSPVTQEMTQVVNTEIIPPAISPAMTSGPALAATGTAGAASPVSGGMTQPALLNLRTGTSPAPEVMSGGASPWLAEAAVTSGDEDIVSPAITAAPAVTRTVSAGVSPAPATRTATGTPAASGPVRVPVEYVFPEMVIPADIIKSITIPVEFALPPRRAGPLPLAGPVSGAVGQGITPPEAPMTQAEQIVYSRIDNYENVKIEVSPEGGTSARIITPPGPLMSNC